MVTSWKVRLLAACCTVATLVGLSSASAQARPPSSYYLSLGDSLAFGYQPNLVAAGDVNPADYHSYAEDLARVDPALSLVNFGCPGETTGTLVAGGCPWPAPLHNSFGGATSQLAAARAFLTAHPGQVSLVSIDIGSNDLLALVSQCEAAATSSAALQICLTAGLPATLTTIATNYEIVLQTVKSLAPGARVVMFNLYNPLAVTLPGSDQLVGVVNQTLAAIATGAHASVANAFGAINIKAGSPIEKLAVCALTWECTSFKNVHPTSLGYASLTLALIAAIR
jgi:lysophospholipase L1-like esterase